LIPIPFPQSNKSLKPNNRDVISEDVLEVKALPIYTNGEQVISCWQMNWKERLSALIHGKVWLQILGGVTQPPAVLRCSKEIFEER